MYITVKGLCGYKPSFQPRIRPRPPYDLPHSVPLPPCGPAKSHARGSRRYDLCNCEGVLPGKDPGTGERVKERWVSIPLENTHRCTPLIITITKIIIEKNQQLKFFVAYQTEKKMLLCLN